MKGRGRGLRWCRRCALYKSGRFVIKEKKKKGKKRKGGKFLIISKLWTFSLYKSQSFQSSSMASEEQQQPQRREEPADECLHKTKVVQFLGRTTPIILQNENGPCPLLAICNRPSLSCISRVSDFYFCLCNSCFFIAYFLNFGDG